MQAAMQQGETGWRRNQLDCRIFEKIGRQIREDVKYYFDDFVHKWGTPPPLQNIFWQKRSYGFGGYPPPPPYELFPENLSSEMAEFFLLKNT